MTKSSVSAVKHAKSDRLLASYNRRAFFYEVTWKSYLAHTHDALMVTGAAPAR